MSINPFENVTVLSDEQLVDLYSKQEGREKEKVFKKILSRWNPRVYRHIFNEAQKVGFNRSIENDDLYQTIMESFTEAVKKYSPEAGTKFSTYAWRAIQNSVNRIVQSFQTGKRAAEMEGIVCIDEVSNILTATTDIEQQFFLKNIISEIKTAFMVSDDYQMPNDVIKAIKDAVKNPFPVCQDSRDILRMALVVLETSKNPMILMEIFNAIEELQQHTLEKKHKLWFWSYLKGHEMLIKRCKDKRWKGSWYVTPKGIVVGRKIKNQPHLRAFKRIAVANNLTLERVEQVAVAIQDNGHNELFRKMLTIIESGGHVRNELTRMYGLDVDEAMKRMMLKAESVLKNIGLSKVEVFGQEV